MSKQILERARSRERWPHAIGAGEIWQLALWGSLVVSCGCATSSLASAQPRSSQPSHAYVDRCQDAVGRDMTEAGVPGEVRFDTGLAIAATPRRMNVQGAAEVRTPGGEPQWYEYSCSFDPQSGDRLSSSGFRRAEREPTVVAAGSVVETGSLVERCQADVQRSMNAQTPPASVRFVTPPATAVTTEVTNVQGDAEVQPQIGPARRYTYFCAFRERKAQP